MMEGTPNLPPKKPGKAMEAIKKVARVLAVGTTLAGVPTAANALNIEGWRRSTNVEDHTNKKSEETRPDIEYTFTGVPAPASGTNPIVQELLGVPGPYDQDIEDTAKRINEEVAAEEAAKRIKIQDKFDTYKKGIDEKIKKEAAQQPPIVVGSPKL